MTVEKTPISYHASTERIERLTACLTTLGYNNFVLQVEDKKRGNGTTQFLTDTGIVIVRNSNNGNLVTGYMATVAQAIKMYRVAGYQKMPDGMYRRVVRNNEKHKELLDIQKQFLTFQKFYAIIIIQKQKELLIMDNYYNTVMTILPGLTDKELNEVIDQATAQLKKNRKDVLVKASQKVLDALKEYESTIIGYHPLYDDGDISIESNDFYIDDDGYLGIR